MINNSKAGNIFLRIILKQEVITYLMPIPVAVAFVISSFDFARNNVLLLLGFASLASFSALAAGILIKYIVMTPIINAIKIINNKDEDNNDIFLKAIKRCYLTPKIDAIVAFLRWSTSIAVCIVLPFFILKKMNIIDIVYLETVGFLNGLVSIPLYYIAAESECVKFFEFEKIKKLTYNQGKFLRTSIFKKIFITILLISLYSILFFLFITILHISGYINIKNSIIGIVILTVGSVIVISFVSYLLAENFKMTINNLKNKLYSMNINEGDLTRKMSISSNDEFGDLSNEFNLYLEKLNMLIKNLKETLDVNKKFGISLAVNTKEIFSTTEEMASSMSSIIDRNVTFSVELGNAIKIVIDINNLIKKIHEYIGIHSDKINQSNVSIKNVFDSIQEYAGVLSEKEQFINEISNYADHGSVEMKKTVESIEEIKNSAKFMGDLIKVINNIANQTNLLAMNAAIEAAHAGETGKGFSVVADEIRNLSVTTSSKVKEITSSLKLIMDNINNASDHVNKTNIEINQIITAIYHVAGSIRKMNSDMTTLSNEGKNIELSLIELNDTTNKINDVSNEMLDLTTIIESSVKTISVLSEENNGHIDKTNLGALDISKSIEELKDISQENEKNINSIEEEINKFKI